MMLSLKKVLLYTSLTFFIVTTLGSFWAKGIILLDSDFGWHIKFGELVLNEGISKTDPFSFTMPSFPFVNHEWLTDVLLYLSYPLLGHIGLAGLFALLAFLTILLPLKNSWNKYTFLLASLAGTSLLPFVGTRVQVLSWFFFAVLLRVLSQNELYNKYFYLLPFFFLIWANLHGGFAAGLALLFYFIIFDYKKRKQLPKREVFIFICCLLATLINPYGLDLWKEVWRTISDSSLKLAITEWMPVVFFPSPSIYLYSLLSLALFMYFRKKLTDKEKFLYLLLFIASLSSARHYPLWLIYSLPITIRGITLCIQSATKNKISSRMLSKASFIFLTIVIATVILQLYGTYKSTLFFEERTTYPIKGIAYLASQNKPLRVFTHYGWGGYVIWKLPDVKVFIDGRMPSWKQEPLTSVESSDAFQEYRDTMNGKQPLTTIINKYHIDTFILINPSSPIQERFADRPIDTIEKAITRKELLPNIYKQLEQLQKSGWSETYKDSLIIIYQKEY